MILGARTLAKTRAAAATGVEPYASAWRHLVAAAGTALTAGPFSVTYKRSRPASGNRHDYLSHGPYWWPNPDSADGLPYVRRDGERNPTAGEYDSEPLASMCAAVRTLALANWFTGQRAYADRAAHLLRVWFLDTETRMNPHLEFGQAVPGICPGRGIGIIDTVPLCEVVDAIGLLEHGGALSSADVGNLRVWFDTYMRWLRESPHGRAEAGQHNNHGTWYDVQVAAFALFASRSKTAREVLTAFPRLRLATQVEPDGAQPHELARTRSWSYALFNLRAMTYAASLARHVDCELWRHETPDGRSILHAIDWLVPYACGDRPWPYPQIAPTSNAPFYRILRQAHRIRPDAGYADASARVTEFDPAKDDLALLAPMP
jgi:hypothetical protein